MSAYSEWPCIISCEEILEKLSRNIRVLKIVFIPKLLVKFWNTYGKIVQ